MRTYYINQVDLGDGRREGKLSRKSLPIVRLQKKSKIEVRRCITQKDSIFILSVLPIIQI